MNMRFCKKQGEEQIDWRIRGRVRDLQRNSACVNQVPVEWPPKFQEFLTLFEEMSNCIKDILESFRELKILNFLSKLAPKAKVLHSRS